MLKCPVCYSIKNLKLYRLYDDRYGYPGYFAIRRCSHCGHKFLEGDFTGELLTNLYTNYYPRSAIDLNNYEPFTEKKDFISWLNGENRSAYCWVPRNVRILDIGCGFGESLGYHESRGCDVYGVDADENIRRVAKKFGFKVHVGIFDPDIYEREFFDYVTMDQVIEHVTDPLETMKGIARVLKPGGFAILSTPNASGWGAKLFGRRWINWHAPYHIQHFSINSIKIAAEQAGLFIERKKTITSSEWLYYQLIHLVTFPEMGRPSVFWSPLAKPGLHTRAFISIVIAIHFIKINHMMTRFFDALGIGDCNLFFLRKK